MKSNRTTRIIAVIVFALALVVLWYVVSGDNSQITPPPTVITPSMTTTYVPSSAQPTTAPHSTVTPSTIASSPLINADAKLRQLFVAQESDVQVSGQGVVTRLLADDNEGDRHQRFILKLASGQTLLVAHNIDLAPRLNGLAVGDTVSFYGEYIYSADGGTIHWTHKDPAGKHVAGWLEWRGQKYQ